MKNCPVCSETYSERIDFCFNDGEVLALLPSAMDAPMPRLVTQSVPRSASGQRGAAERFIDRPRQPDMDAPPTEEASLRAQPTEEAPTEMSGAARTAEIPAEDPSVEAPVLPNRPDMTRSDGTRPDGTRPDGRGGADRPSDRPSDAPPDRSTDRLAERATDAASARPVHVEKAPPPAPKVSPERAPAGPIGPLGSDRTPAPTPEVRQPSPSAPQGSSSAVRWFVGAAVLTLAVMVLIWQLGGTTQDVRRGSGETIRTSTPRPEVPAPRKPIDPPPVLAPPAPPAGVVTAPTGEVPPPGAATPPAPPAVVSPATEGFGEPATIPLPPPPAAPAPAPGAPAPVRGSTPSPLQSPPLAVKATPPADAPAATTTSPWDAPPVASVGHVEITSHPSGASVRIDGKVKGPTPFTIDLPYGSYSIELDLAGYVPVRKRIDVQSAEPRFPITMDAEVRRGNVLVVFQDWDGATLTVDGEIRGQLPATVMLSEGMHTFVVKREHDEVRLRREVVIAQTGLTRLLLHQ